jgi:hypothetical protein
MPKAPWWAYLAELFGWQLYYSTNDEIRFRRTLATWHSPGPPGN